MRNKSKLIIALFLSFLIIFSNISFVFAEDEIINTEEPQIEQVEKTETEEVKIEEIQTKEVKEIEEVKKAAKIEIENTKEVEEAAKIEIENTTLVEETKIESESIKLTKSIENPVTKVTVNLLRRTQNGWGTAQTWTAVAGGSNTWKNGTNTTIKYSPITIGNTTYTFKNIWKDELGNTYEVDPTYSKRYYGSDFIALFEGQEGPTATLNVYAQYDETSKINVQVNFQNNINETGNHSWSNGENAEFNGFSNATENPYGFSPQYEFLYYNCDWDSSHYSAETPFILGKNDVSQDTIINLIATYNYQPAVKVIYHYKNGLKDTGEQLSNIDIYENQPAQLYWFYENEETPIVKGTVALLPDKKLAITEKQNITKQVDVYAHYYTVTWENEDGTVLEIDKDVSYKNMPTYDGETPTKKADAQYTYTFKGWNKEVVEVTNDITYTAIYEKTINKYNIKFLNYDNTLLQEENLNYGVLPEYKQSTPIKNATAQYTYIFNRWIPEIIKVITDAVYIAQYNAIINTYTVTWLNDNGIQLEQDTNVEYGTLPSYDGVMPTKAATEDYTYTFKGWDKELNIVTENVTYIAVYESTIIEKPIISNNKPKNPSQPQPQPQPQLQIQPQIQPTEDITVATTNPPITIINPAPTPKAEPEGSWALINLIATILACICALILLFVRKDTEDDEPTDEEKKDMRKILVTKIASVLVGIISIIVFILTEDMSLPMALTDKWTFLMILLLIIEIVNIFIIRRQSKGEEDNDSN